MDSRAFPDGVVKRLRPHWFRLLLTSLVSGLLFMTLTLFGFEDPLMLLLMFIVGFVCISGAALYVLLAALDPELPDSIIGALLNFERRADGTSGSWLVGWLHRSADWVSILIVLAASLYATWILFGYLF